MLTTDGLGGEGQRINILLTERSAALLVPANLQRKSETGMMLEKCSGLVGTR
jgi:hypothetical protein